MSPDFTGEWHLHLFNEPGAISECQIAGLAAKSGIPVGLKAF